MNDSPGSSQPSTDATNSSSGQRERAPGKALQVIDTLFREYARSDGRHDIPLANPEVEEIVAKALGIAEHLNQTEIRVAHILLAMTLTEDGKKRLSDVPQLSEAAIRDACWEQLHGFFQLPRKSTRVVVSTELKRLMDAAFNLTLSRNILNQPLQVEDFLKAIQSPSFCEEFAGLLTNTTKKTAAEQSLDLTKETSRKLDYYQPRILTGVESLGALGREQLELLNRLAVTIAEAGGTFARMESRIRNIKRFILANLGLGLVTFAVVIASAAVIALR